jgi:hypothetical protein
MGAGASAAVIPAAGPAKEAAAQAEKEKAELNSTKRKSSLLRANEALVLAFIRKNVAKHSPNVKVLNILKVSLVHPKRSHRGGAALFDGSLSPTAGSPRMPQFPAVYHGYISE